MSEAGRNSLAGLGLAGLRFLRLGLWLGFAGLRLGCAGLRLLLGLARFGFGLGVVFHDA